MDDQIRARRQAETGSREPSPKGLGPARSEFVARFQARMLARAGDAFEDGGSVAEYAEMAAASYWDDISQRAEGPEECADADISYWGDE